jgi:hypothetical protein
MVNDNRVNYVETNIKNNKMSSITTNDLLYYLYYVSKNSKINPNVNNENNIKDFLNKIKNSFSYENIFVNKDNYLKIATGIIGLLIPFYYNYPRFYKLGFLGVLIGIISFFSLASTISSLYSNFFSKITYIFYILTVLIYFIFFILLNKLNHISLFFISAILAFLFINYILRLIILSPTKNNPYNKYQAKYNNNSNNKFTDYNDNIEAACIEINTRYNLNLPSGRMLYSYLTIFNIEKNNDNQLINFILSIIGPFISIFILGLLGYCLNLIKIKEGNNEFNIFPIVGINDDSYKYLTCQCNYILPKRFNIDLFINDFFDKYDNKIKNENIEKIIKALRRISHKYLDILNPIFNIDEDNKNKLIVEYIKDSKIIEALKEKELNNSSDKKKYNISSMTGNNKPMTGGNKLNNIANIKLAREVFRDDEIISSINRDDKELLSIIDKYIKSLCDILNDNGKTDINEYYNNIITQNSTSENVTKFSNKIFKFILGLLSTWFLFSKTILSPIFISHMLIFRNNFQKYVIENKSTFWKVISMGMDLSYFDNIENIPNENTFNITKYLSIFYYILLFFIFLPLTSFYNSSIFGMTSNPIYYNFIIMLIVIINICINIYKIKNNVPNLLSFNIVYIILIVIIFIVYQIVMYNINKK